MNAIPIALFWALAAWGWFGRSHVLIYLYFATIPIGAFAVIPTGMTGGLTFTATPVVALLIIVRTFFRPNGMNDLLRLAVLPQNLMLLFLYWIVAAIITFYMPRIFDGAVMVVPFRGVLSESAPLHPTVQNLSQFSYISISILSVFAFTRMFESLPLRQHALLGLYLGGGVTIATGLLDYLTQFLPITPLLAPFRTASYALMTEVEVLGSKRVVGLMPEASAYGAICLGFLSAIYFYRHALIKQRAFAPLTLILLALLLLCAWLSKSSGTYVGIAILAVVALLEWLVRAYLTASTETSSGGDLLAEPTIVALIFAGIAALLIAYPDAINPIYSLIDRMVLQKDSSASYAEREMWRTVAFSSLMETYGFGVGLGSTRASSSLVAIFSNTGIIGGILFYCFALKTLLIFPSPKQKQNRALSSAFRFSFIPTFIVTLMVGDADFGALLAFSFGITTAAKTPLERISTGMNSARIRYDSIF